MLTTLAQVPTLLLFPLVLFATAVLHRRASARGSGARCGGGAAARRPAVAAAAAAAAAEPPPRPRGRRPGRRAQPRRLDQGDVGEGPTTATRARDGDAAAEEDELEIEKAADVDLIERTTPTIRQDDRP